MRKGRKMEGLRLGLLFLLLLAFVGMAQTLHAQQAQLYTQFMYNKLHLNAGYAGSLEAPSAQILYRKQWLDLEGAPEAQVASFHLPLGKKIGLGMNVDRQVIGIQEHITVEGVYVYRLQLSKKGFLGLGVNVSGRYFAQDFTDERLQTTQAFELDRAIERGVFNKWVANIGFGAYYQSPKFYFGASIPRLAKSPIDFDEDDEEESQEERHLNIMTGYSFDLNDNVTFTPQMMLRFTTNAPFDLDINAMFGFYNRFFAGLSYRHYNGELTVLAESIDVLAGVNILPNLYLGVAYDFTLSELRNYSNGSIEIMTRYNFLTVESEDKYVNPRFF